LRQRKPFFLTFLSKTLKRTGSPKQPIKNLDYSSNNSILIIKQYGSLKATVSHTCHPKAHKQSKS